MYHGESLASECFGDVWKRARMVNCVLPQYAVEYSWIASSPKYDLLSTF